jgi:hypothetical protein
MEYNSNNDVIKRTSYNEDDKIEFITHYEYDNDRNLLKFHKTNEKNETIDLVIFKYDEKNRVIEQKIGDYYITKFTYNDDERTKTEERYDLNGVLQFKMISYYDEEGRLLEEASPIHSTKYIYEFF